VKLLLDENLSHTLVERLADLFPESTHVRNIGLETADDGTVWKYAIENGFVLISKDADMHDRSLLYGFPPKVIWIRLGNCSTNDVENLLRRETKLVGRFFEDEVASFLVLSYHP
jgi:predicted nuclease of predicted toxin-antitoxin system